VSKGSGSVGILGAIVFLLSLNTVYALVKIAVGGPQANINILLLLGGTCNVPVSVYFSISASAATLSLVYLFSLLISKLTMESDAKTLEGFEAKLQDNRHRLEKAVTKTFAGLSMDEFKITEGLKNIEMRIIENQKRIEKIGKMRDKYAKAMERQIFVLNEMEKKIEKMESRLTPKPHLTGRSDIQEISGVGQTIAEELKSVGLTNVDDLLIEDPAVIAQRTELSRNKIEKIQGVAQFLMIPGVDKNKVRLFQKAGVMSADNLAGQGPIQLFKKIASVAEDGDDKPTLEELASYVRFARSNFNAF